MRIDDDILIKFPHTRDGLIFVYLMAKAKNGLVEMTYQQMSKDTGYTIKQIRSSIAILVENGSVNINAIAGIGVEISINNKEHVKKEIINIEKRKSDFYNSLVPYLGKYPKEMIRAFFNYWTERNKSGTKMRFELEKTWETDKRLMTWANNENKYGKPTINNRASAADKAASRNALEELADRILEQY